jgi:hypothetical protein
MEEVLGVPQPCSDQLDVITSAAPLPAFARWSLDIKAGDRLEVFGAYHTNPGRGRAACTLYGLKAIIFESWPERPTRETLLPGLIRC